jgi:hypothetical protein
LIVSILPGFAVPQAKETGLMFCGLAARPPQKAHEEQHGEPMVTSGCSFGHHVAMFHTIRIGMMKHPNQKPRGSWFWGACGDCCRCTAIIHLKKLLENPNEDQ